MTTIYHVSVREEAYIIFNEFIRYYLMNELTLING